MYINKNDLVNRLVEITGKDKREFASKTVAELSSLYETYASGTERTYLEVPYKDKNVVKLLGARYDGDKKKWYVPDGVDVKNFDRWLQNLY